MTWIIANPLFGDNSIIIADTRMTLKPSLSGHMEKEEYKDGLLKIHLLGPANDDFNFIYAFSGDVEFAFLILSKLRRLYASIKLENGNKPLNLQEFIQRWCNEALESPDLIRSGDKGVKFFLAGHQIGNFPSAQIYMLSSENYVAELLHNNLWAAIGSGVHDKICIDIIEKLNTDTSLKEQLFWLDPHAYLDRVLPQIANTMEGQGISGGVNSYLSCGLLMTVASQIGVVRRVSLSPDASPIELSITTQDQLDDYLDGAGARSAFSITA